MKWTLGAVAVAAIVAGCAGSRSNDVGAISAVLASSPATYLHYGEKTWGVKPRIRVLIRRSGDRAVASLSAPGAIPEHVVLRRSAGKWGIASTTGGVINGHTASRPAAATDRAAIWAIERRRIFGGHDSCVRHVVVTVSTVDPRYATITYQSASRTSACGPNGQILYVHRSSGWRILDEGDGFLCNSAPAGVVRSLFGACWVGVRG